MKAAVSHVAAAQCAIHSEPQSLAKFGIGKYLVFVFGQKTKSVEELLYGPVVTY
jgi:hypothetical protein